MKPIVAPPIINKGIAVYLPTSASNNFTTITINYSKSNPLYRWRDCDQEYTTLWKLTRADSPDGLLFLYETTRDLEVGFYTILLTNTTGIKGQQTIGLIEPTPYVIIGLPYSIYSPIILR